MWKKDDSSKLTINEAVSEFRWQADPLIAAGDLDGLRKVFSRWLAEARVSNSDDQITAISTMRETLQEVLSEPSRRVRRDWFDDV